MSAAQTTISPLARWVAFCRAHGEPCFTGWPEEFLAQWLRFHAGQRTLIVINQGDEILALGVAWQCRRAELEQHWHADDPEGECIILSQAVATSRESRRELIGQFNLRWPNWRNLEVYARRGHKGLVRMWPKTLEKLFAL